MFQLRSTKCDQVLCIMSEDEFCISFYLLLPARGEKKASGIWTKIRQLCLCKGTVKMWRAAGAPCESTSTAQKRIVLQTEKWGGNTTEQIISVINGLPRKNEGHWRTESTDAHFSLRRCPVCTFTPWLFVPSHILKPEMQQHIPLGLDFSLLYLIFCFYFHFYASFAAFIFAISSQRSSGAVILLSRFSV